MTASVSARPATDASVVRPLRRRGRSLLLLQIVVLVVIGGLLGAWAYRNATSRAGVVAVVRALPYGAVVQIGDLRSVDLPTDTGLTTIPWADAERVVGLVATTDLRAGQTLTPDAVGLPAAPAADEAIVGLSVPAGRVPGERLEPRDRVLVITGSGPGRAGSVVHSGEPDVSGRRTIDVLVSRTDATDLAVASFDDRLAVVLIGRG